MSFVDLIGLILCGCIQREMYVGSKIFLYGGKKIKTLSGICLVEQSLSDDIFFGVSCFSQI